MDFYDLFDRAVEGLDWDSSTKANEVEFARRLLARVEASDETWLVWAPVGTLRLRQQSGRARVQRLGPFTLNPEHSAKLSTGRKVAKLRSSLGSYGATQFFTGFEVGEFFFEHHDRKFSRALSELPFLSFEVRGAMNRAREQAKRHVLALEVALLATESLYADPGLPDLATSGAAQWLRRRSEHSQSAPSANWFMMFNRAGWYDRVFNGLDLWLPRSGLLRHRRSRRQAEAILAVFLSGGNENEKDGLRERAIRCGEMLAEANRAHARYLQFLLTMIGLECVISGSGATSEIQYRLADTVGILLGDSPTTYREIRAEVTELYKRRSKLVHEGQRGVAGDWNPDFDKSFSEDDSHLRKARWLLSSCIRRLAKYHVELCRSGVEPADRDKACSHWLDDAKYGSRR